MPIEIEFNPPGAFEKGPKKRARFENEVRASPDIPAGTVKAIVVNGPHTSHMDNEVHITFDCYDAAGTILGRYHVQSSYTTASEDEEILKLAKDKKQLAKDAKKLAKDAKKLAKDTETLAEGSAKGYSGDQQ